MALKKVTELQRLLAPALSDVIYIVDVSDTTENPLGSSFQVLVEDILALHHLHTASQITDFFSAVTAIPLNALALPEANVDLNNKYIVNLPIPQNANDAVNKQYVDSLLEGRKEKESVRLASTANIDLTTGGLITIDGIAVLPGDRVLVKNQNDATENGIYIASSNSWTRSLDANISSELPPGTYVFVSEGDTQQDQGFSLVTDAPINIGTTLLNFTQTSGAGQIIDGQGLTKTGNVLAVNTDGVTTEISGDNIRVKDLGISNDKLANQSINLQTKIDPTTKLPVAQGGTGADSATVARTNLGLQIGSDVQAYNAKLQAIVNATPSKGTIFVFNGTDLVPLGVGTDTYILTADSSQPSGIRWNQPSSGGGGGGNFSKVAETTLVATASTFTISGLDLDADKKYKIFFDALCTANGYGMNLLINNDSTDANYSKYFQYNNGSTVGNVTTHQTSGSRNIANGGSLNSNIYSHGEVDIYKNATTDIITIRMRWTWGNSENANAFSDWIFKYKLTTNLTSIGFISTGAPTYPFAIGSKMTVYKFT